MKFKISLLHLLLLLFITSLWMALGGLCFGEQNSAGLPVLNLPAVSDNSQLINLSDFSGGLNRKAFPTQLKENEAQTLVNAWWDKFGALGRRKGWTHLTIPDTAIGITGLYRFYQYNGNRFLMVTGDTILYRAKNDSTVFVKIKSGIPTGSNMYFTTYKDNLVGVHKGIYGFKYDSLTLSDLGLIDSIYTQEIQVSGCTTIYESRDAIWDTDELIGSLIYNPFDDFGGYQLICGNTSNKIYTLNDPNLVKNGGFEQTVSADSLAYWEWWSPGDDGELHAVTVAPWSGARNGAETLFTAGTVYGRLKVRGLTDSVQYKASCRNWVGRNVQTFSFQVRRADDTSAILGIVTMPGSFYTERWIQRTIYFNSVDFDSIWIYIVDTAGAGGAYASVHWDDVKLERKDLEKNFTILLYNWFNEGSTSETGMIDSTDDESYYPTCKEYLYGLTITAPTNDFIEITSGNAKGQIRLLKEYNGDIYVEPPFDPPVLDTTTETNTYKIYKRTFWKSEYLTVYNNRLILLCDSISKNIAYYTNPNEWFFPPLNLFTTYTPDGSKITGVATLYNDQMGQRSSSDDKLIIFKENDLLGCGSTFMPYVISTGIGAVAPRSIVNVEGLFVGFAHTSGFYGTDGNQVTLLSEKIKPFWESINKSKMNLITAGYYDKHIFISVPYGTATENDTGLIYNIDNKSWSTANIKASVFANQWGLSDTIKFLWGRPDTGWVCRYGVSNFDNGTDSITLTYKSKEFDFDPTKQERFRDMYLAYDQNSALTTLNFYKDFGASAIWSYSLTGTGKTIKKIPISELVYGKTLSWGLTSKDPGITISDVRIRLNLIGGY